MEHPLYAYSTLAQSHPSCGIQIHFPQARPRHNLTQSNVQEQKLECNKLTFHLLLMKTLEYIYTSCSLSSSFLQQRKEGNEAIKCYSMISFHRMPLSWAVFTKG